MKAKKSIDRLLRDASDQPQALPPVDDCWQEFSALLDSEPQQPSIVFGNSLPKVGRLQGGTRLFWFVLMGIALVFMLWQRIESTQTTANTNAPVRNHATEHTVKLPQNLSAPITNGNSAAGMSQAMAANTFITAAETKQQTANRTRQHARGGRFGAQDGNRPPSSVPAKAFHQPGNETSLPGRSFAIASAESPSALLPGFDSGTSNQGSLLPLDGNEVASLPVTNALCPLDLRPTPAPTNITCPVMKTRPHWGRTGYIGWEPHFIRPDYPTSAAHWLSVGASLQRQVKPNWGLKTELWWHRFSIPRLTLVNVQHLEVDGQRLTQYDSNLIHQVDRISLNLLGTTNIRGFGVSGGLALGYLVGAYQESFGRINSITGGVTGSSYGLGYGPFPPVLRRFSIGIKGSVEYHFASKYLLGVGLYQGLNDAIRSKRYNTFQNLYFYAGYKF